MKVGSKIKFYRGKKKLTQSKLGELPRILGERIRSFENNNFFDELIRLTENISKF